MKVRLRSNPQATTPLWKAGVWLFVLPAVLILALLATVPLEWRDQAIFGLATVTVAAFLSRISASRSVTLSLVVLSVFTTCRYAYWRLSETYQHLAEGRLGPGLEIAFVMLLLGAEMYAVALLILGFHQTARPLNRRPEPLPDDHDSWPVVDVFIPTYNEPLDIVRSTVISALNMDWPAEKLRVYILDDGNRPEFKQFADEVGSGYITRVGNKHAKAGNINNALEKTNGEYVLVFDCDHVPTRSFLQFTMGWFLKDPNLAILQTPHHFYSADPFERNLDVFREVPNEGALFYGIIQDGNDFWNATFFCGSCAVLRRSALEECGGIAVETVTEDAHTSLRIQRAGWNTAYLATPQAGGLATATLAEHIQQRIRWARGMIQILRVENPLFGRGLTLAQRFCYFNAVAHFLFALPRLIFLTAPLAFLLLGISNMYGYVVTILTYAVPHLILTTITNSRIQGRFRLSFWNEVYETVLAPYILFPTLAALVNPRWGKFNVTPKVTRVNRSYFDWRIASPFIFLTLLTLAGIVSGGLKLMAGDTDPGTVYINLFWCAHNLVLLGAALAVASERAQRRTKPRVAAGLSVTLHAPGQPVVEAETLDLSETGVAVRYVDSFNVAAGVNAHVQFPLLDEGASFPIQVIDNRKGLLRARFTSLTAAQEESIVRVVYGRADSWLDWNKGPEDRPLMSYVRILGISISGFFSMLGSIGRGSHNPEPNAVPSMTMARVQQGVGALVLALIALFFASRAHGAPKPPVMPRATAKAAAARAKAAETTASTAFNDVIDLRAMGLRDLPALDETAPEVTVNFNIPATKVATGAELTVVYHASPNLRSRSQLMQAHLNGVPVASISMEPGPSAQARITIPADLLMRENALAFRIDPACAPDCGKNPPPVQAASLDLTTNIRMSGLFLPLANDLQLLPSPFFDASKENRTTLNFVVPGDADNRTLQAAGVVASWFGVLADHRGMHFPVTSGAASHGNAVVLAINGSPLAERYNLLPVAGPTISVRDNPDDQYGKLLIIQGMDSAEVLSAAQALAVGQVNLMGEQVSVRRLPAPADRPLYDAPRWLKTDHPMAFSSMAAPETLRVNGAGSVRLYFRLPPDLYYGSRSTAPMTVRYQYANLPEGTRGQVQVRLNGVEIASEFVPAREGGAVRKLSIQVPVTLLYPRNTLTVEFKQDAMRPAPGARQSVGTVLGNSELDLSEIPHFAQLPRLDLFAKAGFPFTRAADLRDTAVVLPANAAPEHLSLYLDLMGLFGAYTGAPATHVSVIAQAQVAESNRDLLVIGPSLSAMLPASWLDRAPLRDDSGAIRLQDSSNPWQRLSALTAFRSERERGALTDALALNTPGVVVQQFASPAGNGRTVVSISALDVRGASELAPALSAAALTEEMSGSVSLYRDGKFQSFRPERDRYFVGALKPREMLNYRLGRQFAVFPIVIGFLALILGVLAARRLESKAGVRAAAQA